MYHNPIQKTCEHCGKSFLTKQSKSKACSKSCAKALWKAKVNALGHNVTKGAGRRKGCTPWNKGKSCPQLSLDNNGFFGKHHNIDTKSKIAEHVLKTKTKNHSLNTSKIEDTIYLKLLTKFPLVLRQYQDERYPFCCDFYIPDNDVFIECNFHWTHGVYCDKIYAPYNKDNPEHKQLLTLWKAKNTKYFNIAINTWTVRDPLKLETAKKNKLNYFAFYTPDEFTKWFDAQ